MAHWFLEKRSFESKKRTSEATVHGGYLQWVEFHDKKGVPTTNPTIKSIGVRGTSFRVVYAYLISGCTLLFIEKI